MQAGEAGAVVTNPISKAVLYQAGFPHPGHTEFLGALTGGTPVMMLACPQLRVVPVTIHVSLRRALEGVTTDAILAVARATHAALRRDFGIAAPRLAIAGLNPHAGEEGAMGREEIDIIRPAIETLRAEGIDCHRPLPAGHDVHRGRPADLRRRDLHVPRPGADPAQDAGHGRRRERDARPADHPHLARPRHRVRHRRAGRGGPGQPDRGPAYGGGPGGPEAAA